MCQNVGVKRCTICDQLKPLEDFTRDKRKRSGRSSCCKPCQRERSRLWRERNPTYLRDYYLAHRPEGVGFTEIRDGKRACTACGVIKPLDDFHRQASGPAGHRTICKACRRAAHRANPEPTRERARQTRARNPTYMDEWRRANRARVNEYDLRRKRSLVGQTMGHSTDYLALICDDLRLQPCDYCGQPGGEVDHIVPLTRGGLHHPQNLAPACRACNSSKGNRLLSEWDGPPALRLVA